MARGPSFSGPLTGWTSSSLTPTTTAAASVDPQLSAGLAQKGWTFKPGSGWTAGTPQPAQAINPATGQPYGTFTQAGANDIDTFRGTPLSDQQLATRQRWAGMGLPTFEKAITEEAMLAGLRASGELGDGSRGGSGGGGGSSDSGSNMLSGGRGAGGGGRGAFTQPTPLEALLASVFPDAVSGSDPNPLNPNTAAPQQGALFRTILGNLGASGSSAPAPAPIAFAQGPFFGGPSTGAQIASTIPGAPSFLAGAINQVNTAGMPAPVMPAAPAIDAAGLAALAAEQRAQANQMAQEKAAMEAAWFQQQQQQQRAQAMTAQRQRQRFGGVSGVTSGLGGVTSGWSPSPGPGFGLY